MIKMICFDMDGTIADLYGVSGWLDMLESGDVYPYTIAKPMYDMCELVQVLTKLLANGIDIRIITWLAKDATPQYKNETRKAKIEWLNKYNFPCSKIHAVQYGTTKANCVRAELGKGETAILIDDNIKVRNGWTLGDTIDPNENLIEMLKELLKNE